MRAKLILYCLGLHTQDPGQRKYTWNPALTEVVTRSTCCKKKETLKKVSCMVQPACGCQH